MAARPNKPGVPQKKARKPFVETPPHNPDPEFYTQGLVHRGPKPPPRHPSLRGRNMLQPDPERKTSGKTYRSDTGGTMRVLKGGINPPKRK